MCRNAQYRSSCAAFPNLTPHPRLSADGGVPGPGDFRDEMFRLAALLQARTKNYAHHLAPPRTELTLDHLEFIKLDETIAKKLHENFHYIGSYRPGFHFGYLDKTSGKIVCIGSVALCDLAHVIDKIKDKIVPAEAFTYTRFFAFRWAPANTFSHFTKRLSSHLIKNFSTKSYSRSSTPTWVSAEAPSLVLVSNPSRSKKEPTTCTSTADISPCAI